MAVEALQHWPLVVVEALQHLPTVKQTLMRRIHTRMLGARTVGPQEMQQVQLAVCLWTAT